MHECIYLWDDWGWKKYVFPLRIKKIVGCWGQNYTLEWTFECFFSHLIKTPPLTCSAGFLTQNINITDDVQASNIQYPLSALLKGRRSIKLWGGVFEFFQFLPPKALKRGLLEQKCGVLLELCQSGGLIESGLLFAWIRYVLSRVKVKIFFWLIGC